MRSKSLLTAALVALSLGLVACGSSGSDSSSTEAETASAGQESGSSESTEGETGSEGASSESDAAPSGKVTWQNEDTAPHTATADDGSFDTGTIEKGKLGSATFKEPGTFTYHCEIHPTMHGTVEVVE